MAHQHGTRCYWDLFECRWQCGETGPGRGDDRAARLRARGGPATGPAENPIPAPPRG